MNVDTKQHKNKIINNKTNKINNKTTNSPQDNVDKTKKNNPKPDLTEEQFIKNEVNTTINEGRIGCNIL